MQEKIHKKHLEGFTVKPKFDIIKRVKKQK